ncbi:MAG: galactose oxidase-like domain-containing protein [Blastococcus sp.]
MNRKTAVLAILLLCPAAVMVSPTAAAAPPVPTSDQQVIAQQNRELDPQALDVDPSTGQPRFTPLPPLHHHGHDRTGTPTASDVMTTEMTAAAVTDPAQVGSWAYEEPFTGDQNMVHVVCSPTGKCLFVVGKNNKFSSYVYNPTTNTKVLVKTPADLFCAGHVLLPDGRALVVGGTLGQHPWKGTNTVYAFDFVTETYQKLSDMAVGRWYPSVVTMSDGRQLITAGYDVNGANTKVVEIFDPKTNVTSRLTPTRSLPLYPRTFQTRKPGQIFYAGPVGAGFWNPVTGAFKAVGGPVGAKGYGYGSCFVGDVRDQNLMIMGGGWPATATTNVIDLDSAAPAYHAGPAMTAAKVYVSCVNLPDGTVFEANGGADNTVAAASRTTALLASLAGPWQAMSPLPAGEHRLYHSLLFLLDDGRVVSVTSNTNDGTGSIQSMSHLVYSPPYLSKGTRPTITSSPTEVTYGGTYGIGSSAEAGRTVTRIAVTTAPSATHSTDLNQRYLSLPLTKGSITFPTEPTIMPPGWYRIWAVDDINVPSVAKWVHLQ